MRVLSIDPGQVATGWAISDAGTFLSAGVISVSKKVRDTLGFTGVCSVYHHSMPKMDDIDIVVVEHVYGSHMIKTSFLAGYLCGGKETVLVTPAAWQPSSTRNGGKAAVRKWVEASIGARELNGLVGGITPASLQEHAVDAIGMSIYFWSEHERG